MSRRVADWLPGPLWLGTVCALATSAGIARMRVLEGAAGRMFAAALTILFYSLFCFVIFLKYRRTRQAKICWQGAAEDDATEVLVAFASQTGFAAQLALQTAQALKTSGFSVRLLELAELDAACLRQARRALFVVSTTGEGDAPDSAATFTRKVMGVEASFDGLQYGLLALGDRSYTQYCAFGNAMDAWLCQHGAQRLFDTIDVDNGDEGALRHWQHHLSVMSGNTRMADWSTPHYACWRLTQRCLLNPASLGAAAYHLALAPPVGTALRWKAGDIAEIGPRNAPAHVANWLHQMQLDAGQDVEKKGRRLPLSELLSCSLLPDSPVELTTLRTMSTQALADHLVLLPHREYSIASLPEDGRLEMLVRQTVLPDGSFGLGSGWLTAHLSDGGEVDVRIRENRSFHPPPEDVPFILIGNGTGMAGLRAQIKSRVAAGRPRNWLLFGERSARHDFFFRDDIERWQATGMLQRVDLAFSRDQTERVYVQDKLRLAGDEVRRWVAAGAAIYVCGSFDGMATGVALVLRDLLGEELLESLAAQGRYRRDVY